MRSLAGRWERDGNRLILTLPEGELGRGARLQSRLLRGDARLEAAAVSDPAHVLRGASGEHVAKIQRALLLLDGAAIDWEELRDAVYGPSTARAVLAYKQRRKIINYSYQTQADDIVGKMTVAALDRELSAREGEPEVCRLAPDRLASRAEEFGQAPPSDAATMARAFRDSRRTLGQAIQSLSALITALSARAKGTGQLTQENIRVFRAATRWLALRTRADQIAAVSHIQSAINLMQRNLRVRTTAGAAPPVTRDPALTDFGQASGVPDDGLRCGDDFFATGPNCRRDVVTHEFFHMVGVHHGANPVSGPDDPANNTTPALALDSANNLSQLVAEITTPGGATNACPAGL